MMWLMLQQDKPDDYVIGTGMSHSVREFVETAMRYVGIELEWQGTGIAEKGIVRRVASRWTQQIKQGQSLVEIDARYFRPTEVDHLCADIGKARRELGWTPRTQFEELVKIMVDYDLKYVGLDPIGEGIAISRTKGFGYTDHDFSSHEKIRE